VQSIISVADLVKRYASGLYALDHVDLEIRRGEIFALLTHYIEEAEEMADRIAVINKGKIILVEDKTALMRKLGKKQLTLHLQKPLASMPADLKSPQLELANGGADLVYTFDAKADTGIADLLRRLNEHGIEFKDLRTEESSLEEIFVSLVHR
jgi:ABC-2 type transport system ATP-binding protein